MPTLTFNIPADKQADMLEALRIHHKMPGATLAALRDKEEQDLKRRLKIIYATYMRSRSIDIDLDSPA
jgi:hypothetical protein